jgi:hypothetical protein
MFFFRNNKQVHNINHVSQSSMEGLGSMKAPSRQFEGLHDPIATPDGLTATTAGC